MRPADGERAAIVGFAGQYGLAARIVRAKLSTLEWIRVADPAAGVADDFQFKAGPTRHALQVKWSQYAGSFAWGELANAPADHVALLTELAEAWKRLRETWKGPLVVHLCTNDYASVAGPQAGTPLAEAAADGPRHFAAFLARSFQPIRQHIAQGGAQWGSLARLSEVEQWASAWDALRAAAGLADDQFVSFIRDFELSFTLADDPLLHPDRESSDADLTKIASTLQELVADPARPVQLSREELLARLGWSDVFRYRHPHRFPVPAVYTANEAARAMLENQLAALTGGYLALVGPAGSGKSTLLASLNVTGRVVRYYGFIPDAPDPLSGRGEADSFLHDLTFSLEEGGLYRSGYGNDLTGQRAILTDQLDQAGRRWADERERTVIIVDGLDHIPREQHPVRSLLDELPPPAALPDGVFVILGSQTAGILHDSIQRVLSRQDRTVRVPPLAPEEVSELAHQAGPGDWMLPGQLTTLVDASEGHPLALTYLLQELATVESGESDLSSRRQRADVVLADASAYGGDVEDRYHGYLRAAGDDPEVLDLLAAVARLRAPVNLDWLATWADPHALTEFTRRAGTFFHHSGSEWRFIHNSFRRFLADETARVSGRVSPERDRHFHSVLADSCARADDWPFYRDEELAHRFLAGEYAGVLHIAAPQQLRAALLDLRPLATARDHALLAVRAAAAIGDYSAYVRMLLFINELWQREHVLDPGKLATAVATVEPAAVTEHVVRGGRLRLSAAAALKCAAAHCATGDVGLGRDVLRACGGLVGLIASSRSGSDREWPESIADWAEVTWYLSGLDQVLTELDHLVPNPLAAAPLDLAAGGEGVEERQREDRDAAAIACRNLAHARCLDLTLRERDDDVLDALIAVIDAEADTGWRARARVARAIAAGQDGMPDQVLRWVRELIDIDTASPDDSEEDEDEQLRADADDMRRSVPLQLRLRAAEELVRAGLADAPEIDELVPPGTAAVWPSPTSTAEGLSPFWSVMSLQRLGEIRPGPLASSSAPGSPLPQGAGRDAGSARFRLAVQALARLEGQQLAVSVGRGVRPAIAANADPIIRLLEVPRQQADDWTGWYVVRGTAPDLLRRLVGLSAEAGGFAELRKLLNMFDLAWTTPERAQYWPVSLQQAVVEAALHAHPQASPWAVRWLEHLDGEIDTRSSDPHDRVEMWLMQARAWANAHDADRGRRAAQAAVQSSIGAGIHEDDRQLSDWLDWLAAAASAGSITPGELIEIIRSYSSRIVSVSREASSDAAAAAERLVQLAFPAEPVFGCAIAEFLCETGVMNEATAVQAVTLAAARDPAVPVMLAATIAASMLLPIARAPSADVTASVHARNDSIDAAALLERAAAVWTLRDNPEGRGSAEGKRSAVSAPAPAAYEAIAPPVTAGALLSLMRATADATVTVPSGGWDAAVERIASMPVPVITARALLEQATRLGLSGAALGSLAALAAHAGDTPSAKTALAETLARTSAYGWLRHTDGGSRLKIFGAALRNRDPELVRLAAHDLAGALTSRSLTGPMSPTDLGRIVQLIAGPGAIAAAWPDVTVYLDEFAPPGPAVPGRESTSSVASPVEALLRWVAGYLGHPVRPLDFGARRVLQAALRLNPVAAQRVLAETVNTGRWGAEAALLAVLTAPPGDQPMSLFADLADAVRAATAGPDAICRSIACRLADRYGLAVAEPAPQRLPATYHLALPPLPRRSVPELDSHGTPLLDLHDPQHLIAPFDMPLTWAAEYAGLEQPPVLNRAAMIATASDDPWIRGGHRAQADRLKNRGQSHTYRPWAYMYYICLFAVSNRLSFCSDGFRCDRGDGE